jgi:phage/plasmid-associated DNA primase
MYRIVHLPSSEALTGSYHEVKGLNFFYIAGSKVWSRDNPKIAKFNSELAAEMFLISESSFPKYSTKAYVLAENDALRKKIISKKKYTLDFNGERVYLNEFKIVKV